MKKTRKCKHQFIGVMTIDGCLWCEVCDKWVKVIIDQVNEGSKSK